MWRCTESAPYLVVQQRQRCAAATRLSQPACTWPTRQPAGGHLAGQATDQAAARPTRQPNSVEQATDRFSRYTESLPSRRAARRLGAD